MLFAKWTCFTHSTDSFQPKGQNLMITTFDCIARIHWKLMLLESREAASAEEITQCSVAEEEPAYGR